MSNKTKKALMYGAGSIGRGFLGQLFSMSGYETCFIDVDDALVNKINNEGQYVITVATDGGYESQTVKNVRAINGKDSIKVADEIANCDIMATAVGVNILPFIAKTIATGIDKRNNKTCGAPLDIIVCENISDGGGHLRNLVAPHIDNKIYFDTSIGFVSASVGRMVPVSTDGKSAEIVVESYNELPIDADALKTDVSKIKNFRPVTPFAIEKSKKYFMHNMSHAIVAYLGFVKGYEHLWEAMNDGYIKTIAERALEESILAISNHYKTSRIPLKEYAVDLLHRYSNKYLNDTVIRVGRDPKRKLQPNDRLTGAAEFCLSEGISVEYILYGIAAAFYFNIPDDTSSYEIIEYVNANGIAAAITKFTAIPPESPLFPKILALFFSLAPKL